MTHIAEVKAEAIRLRTQEFLGLKEIATLLQISKSTASIWLEDFPLPADVLEKKRSFKNEKEVLRTKSCPATMLGMASEYIFIAKAMLAGFECFTPVSAGSRIDVVVGDHLFKCQVKTLASGRGAKKLPVRKIGCNSKTNTKSYVYSSKDVDFMIGVDVDTFDVYVVPIQDIAQYKSLVSINILSKYKNNFSVFITH